MKSFREKHKNGQRFGMKYKMKIGSIQVLLLNTTLNGIDTEISQILIIITLFQHVKRIESIGIVLNLTML